MSLSLDVITYYDVIIRSNDDVITESNVIIENDFVHDVITENGIITDDNAIVS
jgi:hypothetical protein